MTTGDVGRTQTLSAQFNLKCPSNAKGIVVAQESMPLEDITNALSILPLAS